MLAELKLKLDVANQKIGYYQSSNLQGVLMEHIDSDYASVLHSQKWNPYSQNIIGKDEKVVWTIRTLNQEAYEKIIKPLEAEAFTEFRLEKKDIVVRVCDKKLTVKSQKELLEEFYQKPADRYLNLEFVTPTAFKSNGRYVIIPEPRLIFQSLMNKYSAASGGEMEMFDTETLDQLTESSEITQYRLKSTGFPLESVRIPSFKGELSIRVRGNDTMARYARFLMQFGEYSGVGIKTAMGMGAIRMMERRTDT
jgi:CRISPR-associated endoribonuclease Cas6